jgi:hypothetical protein
LVGGRGLPRTGLPYGVTPQTPLPNHRFGNQDKNKSKNKKIAKKVRIDKKIKAALAFLKKKLGLGLAS